jgi:hypothetical protein
MAKLSGVTIMKANPTFMFSGALALVAFTLLPASAEAQF